MGGAETWTSDEKFNNEGANLKVIENLNKIGTKILWLYGHLNTLEQCKISSL